MSAYFDPYRDSGPGNHFSNSNFNSTNFFNNSQNFPNGFEQSSTYLNSNNHATNINPQSSTPYNNNINGLEINDDAMVPSDSDSIARPKYSPTSRMDAFFVANRNPLAHSTVQVQVEGDIVSLNIVLNVRILRKNRWKLI